MTLDGYRKYAYVEMLHNQKGHCLTHFIDLASINRNTTSIEKLYPSFR